MQQSEYYFTTAVRINGAKNKSFLAVLIGVVIEEIKIIVSILLSRYSNCYKCMSILINCIVTNTYIRSSKNCIVMTFLVVFILKFFVQPTYIVQVCDTRLVFGAIYPATRSHLAEWYVISWHLWRRIITGDGHVMETEEEVWRLLLRLPGILRLERD